MFAEDNDIICNFNFKRMKLLLFKMLLALYTSFILLLLWSISDDTRTLLMMTNTVSICARFITGPPLHLLFDLKQRLYQRGHTTSHMAELVYV